jgi:hypothetical protein
VLAVAQQLGHVLIFCFLAQSAAVFSPRAVASHFAGAELVRALPRLGHDASWRGVAFQDLDHPRRRFSGTIPPLAVARRPTHREFSRAARLGCKARRVVSVM